VERRERDHLVLIPHDLAEQEVLRALRLRAHDADGRAAPRGRVAEPLPVEPDVDAVLRLPGDVVAPRPLRPPARRVRRLGRRLRVGAVRAPPFLVAVHRDIPAARNAVPQHDLHAARAHHPADARVLLHGAEQVGAHGMHARRHVVGLLLEHAAQRVPGHAAERRPLAFLRRERKPDPPALQKPVGPVLRVHRLPAFLRKHLPAHLRHGQRLAVEGVARLVVHDAHFEQQLLQLRRQPFE